MRNTSRIWKLWSKQLLRRISLLTALTNKSFSVSCKFCSTAIKIIRTWSKTHFGAGIASQSSVSSTRLKRWLNWSRFCHALDWSNWTPNKRVSAPQSIRSSTLSCHRTRRAKKRNQASTQCGATLAKPSANWEISSIRDDSRPNTRSPTAPPPPKRRRLAAAPESRIKIRATHGRSQVMSSGLPPSSNPRRSLNRSAATTQIRTWMRRINKTYRRNNRR